MKKITITITLLILFQLFLVNSQAQDNKSEIFWEEKVFTLIGSGQPNITSLIETEQFTHPALVNLFDQTKYDLISGRKSGILLAFQNIGDDPSQIDLDHPEVVFSNVYSHSAPHFLDFNNDGFLDLLVGMESGGVDLFIANGIGGFDKNNSLITNVGVDGFSKPTSTDLNNDGLLDIILGTEDGNLVAFINPDSPFDVWEKETNVFSRVKVGSHASPTVVDPDKDGNFDLVVGSENLGLVYVRNLGPKDNSNFFEYDQIPFSNRGNPFFSIDFAASITYSTPLIFDLNDDKFPDLLVGSESDGIRYYINQGIDLSKVELQEDPVSIINIILTFLAILIFAVSATVFIVKKRSEVTGKPIFLMMLHSIGIAPFRYKFTEDMDVDILLAGGAFVGIQNIVTEITGAPDLKAIDSGENKILISRVPFPNINTELQILVWSTNEDKDIRNASIRLAEFVVDVFEENFDMGSFDASFDKIIIREVETHFSKWID